jgi:hypothetical protein
MSLRGGRDPRSSSLPLQSPLSLPADHRCRTSREQPLGCCEAEFPFSGHARDAEDQNLAMSRIASGRIRVLIAIFAPGAEWAVDRRARSGGAGWLRAQRGRPALENSS